MSRSLTVDPSGRPQLVERFADDEEMRDLQGASRLYRRHALPDEDDRPIAEETEAARILQAAAELKSEFEVEPLHLLRRTCRAEERLRGFIERQRGERIEGPLTLAREEILKAMEIPWLWHSPTLRQAVDDRRMNANVERSFISALGKAIAHWSDAGPDRVGSVLLALDDQLRTQGQDLAKRIEDNGGTVVVDGERVIEEPNAGSIRRRLRRIRKEHGLSRPRGRPKKKTDR